MMAPTSRSANRLMVNAATCDPRRLEFWSERYDQQRSKCPNPVHAPTEDFQACRVGPMRILEDHQDGILLCQGLDLGNERLQRSLPPLFRGEVEHGIASIVR
jgi:hypothetical protein